MVTKGTEVYVEVISAYIIIISTYEYIPLSKIYWIHHVVCLSVGLLIGRLVGALCYILLYSV